MFKHLKLSSLNILSGVIIMLLGAILTSGLYIMRSQVKQIDHSWQTYINDRSDKARLENHLRAAIGYGGMIHNIKNYILRADETNLNQIKQQISVAFGVIDQYATLPLSEGEQVALNDISQVLQAYKSNLQRAQAMHQSGLTPGAIDQAIRINDSLALRGLQVLGQEVQTMAEDTSAPVGKGRHIAKLRAAIGYGGMIHHFKNYILRQNETHIELARQALQSAFEAIEEYEKKTLSSAEEIALQDIKTTLHHYKDNLHKVTECIESGQPPAEIDSSVSIDDSPALRGLKILDREVSSATERNITFINRQFKQISSISKILTVGLALTIFFFVIFLMWIYSKQVMQPMLKLEKTMQNIAGDNLDTTINDTNLDNELGSMNRALQIFQRNAITRKKSEQQLAIANDNMEQQLWDIQQLKERADQQTRKAMNLANNMDKARITAEEAIIHAKQNEQKVSSILNTVTDSILTIDSSGLVESFNPGAEIMFGYRQSEIIGQQFFILLSQTDDNPAHTKLATLLQNNNPLHEITTEHTGIRKNNSHFPIQFTLNKMTVDNTVKFTCVIHNLTKLKKAEEEIRRLALTDPLTGLANRHQFNGKFKEMMSISKRLNYNMALLMLDLDKFKPVNDTYGHPVGDELLVQIALQLKKTGRDIDLIARLGGDEFAILLNGIEDATAVQKVAERVITAINQPLQIQSHTIQIGVSIGISLYPADADNQTNLVRYADLALYKAKETACHFCFYNPKLKRRP